MDKPYCKCCEYFSITRGSKSLKDSIHCQKHNTVCAVTDENLHGSCSDFKARNSRSIIAKALEVNLMREILFRGKRKNDGKWVCGFYERTWLTNGEVIAVIRDVEEPFRMQISHEVIPETVGQYTGLTDRNGKRIFEGTIVARRRDVSTIYLFVVKWCSECGMWVLADFEEPEDDYTIDFEAFDACTFEVIGNIHDNPELLRDGEQSENT